MIIDTTQTKIERQIDKAALIVNYGKGLTKMAAAMRKISDSSYVAVTKLRPFILLTKEEQEWLCGSGGER